MTTVAVYRQVRRCWDLDIGKLIERKEVVSFFPMPDEKHQQAGTRYTHDGIPRGLLARGRLVRTPTTYGVEFKGGTVPIMVALPDGAEVFDAKVPEGGKPWRIVEWGKRNLWADELLRLAEAGGEFKIAEVRDDPDESASIKVGGLDGARQSEGGLVLCGHVQSSPRCEGVTEDAGPEAMIDRGQEPAAAPARRCHDGHEDIRGILCRGVDGVELPNDARGPTAGVELRSPDGRHRLILPPGYRGETDGAKIVVVGGDKHITTSWAMIAASVKDRPDWRLEVVEAPGPKAVETVAESAEPAPVEPAPAWDRSGDLRGLGTRNRRIRKESPNQLLMF